MNRLNIDQSPIAAVNVSKSFAYNGHSATVINNISLSVRKGELLLLLGPSGSGKTTLLTIMAGLLPPSDGAIYLFGKNIMEYLPKELQKLRAGRIGFIFQTFHLIDAYPAVDNIALSGRFAGMSSQSAAQKAGEILRRLKIEYLADKLPFNLSQGEKQRVAVARAFINKPDIILADEPTASLESCQGIDVIRLLHEYTRLENKSVVVVSHDRRICGYADRILCLQDGILGETDAADNLKSENIRNRQVI